MDKKNIVIGSAVGTAILSLGTVLYLTKRSSIPKGAEAVKPFDVKKYMGKWHEIARMDYLFEKSLDNVTAEYSLNEDGSVKVINTGYNYKKSEKEESIGRAIFAGDPTEAKLKVSFWGPIYGGYNVIAIDKAYKYALVVGRNRNYMWLLSRETSMPEDVKNEYLQKAKELGFKIEKLVWSEHK
ncbi:MAG: lipocalin family protein [Tannerella sp.]|jgi:apolipoprotein D and lipocalin family protein|nr:lipocalin family protein [Tannerella sp.]